MKEPICINAKFAIGAGINTTIANTIEITPNIIDKTLSLKELGNFNSYSLLDMSGRILKEGDYTETLDLSNFVSGRYQIILKENNNSKIGTFIKK